jgi:hypothetical protein
MRGVVACVDCIRWREAMDRLLKLYDEDKLAWAEKYMALEIRLNQALRTASMTGTLRPEGLLDINQAAALAKKTTSSIYQWAQNGWLPRRKIDNRHYYAPADVLTAMKTAEDAYYARLHRGALPPEREPPSASE